MDYLIAGGAFLVGAALAYGNYRISEHFLQKRDNLLAFASVIRQIINLAYLAGLFFLGKYTPLNQWALLIGGALGMTLPGILFTARLVQTTDKDKTERKEDRLKD